MTVKSLSPNQAFQYFFQDRDWMLKTGIGGMFIASALVILIFNIIFLPVSFCLWSLVTGYLLAIAQVHTKARESTNHAESMLPNWQNWLELMISGLTWIAVMSGQLLIWLMVATLSFLIGKTSGALEVLNPHFLPWAIISWCTLISLAAFISFLSAYLMVHFATSQNIISGFSIMEVLRRFRRYPKEFIQAWLMQIGLQSLAILIPLLTIVGAFLIPSALFIAQAVGVILLTEAWQMTD